MTELFDGISELVVGRDEGHRYVIVLAGGDGTRLAGVAHERYGYARPKQYCAFGTGRSLLDDTLARAIRLAERPDRVVVSISRGHRAEAQRVLARWPSVVAVEQPRNLGTTPGTLLPLLHVLSRDPRSTVLLMPADHVFDDDERFVHQVRVALDGLDDDPSVLVLGAAQLRDVQDGLGWIVPGPTRRGWCEVQRMVEKPTLAHAADLHAAGALANMFVVAARGATLASAIRCGAAQWWTRLTASFYGGDPSGAYRSLPPSDLSADVLVPAAHRLRAVPLRDVGWMDVGTPERLHAAGGRR